MRHLRSTIASALALLFAGILLGLTPTSAHAADIYRYWSYFTVTEGGFTAAETGPSGATPEDGAIEGYRYAAPADFTKPNLPRADLDEVTFETVCGDEEAGADQKRVAVLIDYGVEQDAPEGITPPQPEARCAVVDKGANGLQVLEAVSPKVRTESGSFGPLLCGINDYPATGCASETAAKGTPTDGEPVEFAIGDDAQADSQSGDDDSNLPLLIGAGVVVVLLGAGGTFLARRRS